MNDLVSTRLDIAVQNKLKSISRSSASKLIESGLVKVNKKPINKPSFKVTATDKLDIDYNPDKQKLPDIKLPVIYEDDDVIVIDKPSGILSHSKGSFNPEATVASWLQSKYRGSNINERSGIVHRLDRLTSGLMITAKNDESSKWLKKQFSERKVKKTYVAVVKDQPKLPKAIIDLPIERNPSKPQSFRVGALGKPAQTEYKILEFSPNYSLLELKPTTGRTHQLRVHLSHLNIPIMGDDLYGLKKHDPGRLLLHASKLELTLPSRKRQVFTSPMPKEFNQYLDNDRHANPS